MDRDVGATADERLICKFPYQTWDNHLAMQCVFYLYVMMTDNGVCEY